VNPGRGVVLLATDHKLPRQEPLDAVRAQVVASWKKQRGSELAAAAAADAVKRLEAGESWDTVVKGLGLTAQSPKFVSRSDQGVPQDLRRDVFEAPKPAAGKPSYQKIELPEGDVDVVELTAVREDPAAEGQPQEAALRRQFAQATASSEAENYATAARADAKVIVNPQALD
jgi:hypothetical protein